MRRINISYALHDKIYHGTGTYLRVPDMEFTLMCRIWDRFGAFRMLIRFGTLGFINIPT